MKGGTNKRTKKQTDGQKDERTKVPLCSTGLCPLRAAAQKVKPLGSVEAGIVRKRKDK